MALSNKIHLTSYYKLIKTFNIDTDIGKFCCELYKESCYTTYKIKAYQYSVKYLNEEYYINDFKDNYIFIIHKESKFSPNSNNLKINPTYIDNDRIDIQLHRFNMKADGLSNTKFSKGYKGFVQYFEQELIKKYKQ